MRCFFKLQQMASLNANIAGRKCCYLWSNIVVWVQDDAFILYCIDLVECTICRARTCIQEYSTVVLSAIKRDVCVIFVRLRMVGYPCWYTPLNLRWHPSFVALLSSPEPPQASSWRWNEPPQSVLGQFFVQMRSPLSPSPAEPSVINAVLVTWAHIIGGVCMIYEAFYWPLLVWWTSLGCARTHIPSSVYVWVWHKIMERLLWHSPLWIILGGFRFRMCLSLLCRKEMKSFAIATIFKHYFL